MISFKKYTDIVGDIAKKLKVTKDKAVNALIKAQERGINPLKWQSNIALLTTFASIVAEYDPTLDEAKQGHALVVGGKIVARGSKKQLLKQIKKDKIKIDHKDNFLTYTGKEVGDSWTEERDYKDEYKKFQSSDAKKKYRAELNKYNRKKGTYGNGDGKDASHKGGKIVGMEDESINKGRAEKSRLKGSKRKK